MSDTRNPPAAFVLRRNQQSHVTTFAIASDLSEIVPTEDGFGIFKSELAAVERWIEMLEGEREVIAERLSRAKRRRRSLARARGEG